MIYSKVAIDYSCGVVKQSDGTLKGNKIGCMVLTIEEAEALLVERRLNGDLKPELIEARFKVFQEEIRKIKGE